MERVPKSQVGRKSRPCVQVGHGESVEDVEWAVRTGRTWREYPVPKSQVGRKSRPCVQVGHGESVEDVE